MAAGAAICSHSVAAAAVAAASHKLRPTGPVLTTVGCNPVVHPEHLFGCILPRLFRPGMPLATPLVHV